MCGGHDPLRPDRATQTRNGIDDKTNREFRLKDWALVSWL